MPFIVLLKYSNEQENKVRGKVSGSPKRMNDLQGERFDSSKKPVAPLPAEILGIQKDRRGWDRQ